MSQKGATDITTHYSGDGSQIDSQPQRPNATCHDMANRVILMYAGTCDKF